MVTPATKVARALCLLPGLLLTALALTLSANALASFTAQAYPLTIDSNGLVTLQLDARGSHSGQPDVTGLEQDFTIVGRQSHSQLSFSGGATTASTRWTLTLKPKRTGVLQIPAIRYQGATSQPISVQVTAPSAAEQASVREFAFMQSEISKQEVWVQEQLLYKVRLYYQIQGALSGDLPQPPAVENAVVYNLGKPRVFNENRDGKTYRVHELGYIITPERSGELLIPAAHFNGILRQGAFGRQGTINIQTRALPVTVKPQPATWPADHPWLPARDLQLAQSWSPSPPEFRVGETLTRFIEVKAEGVAAASLPEIAATGSNSLSTYAEQPRMDDALVSGRFVSTRIESLVMIPRVAGTLTLPETEVLWWDVEHSTIRKASLASLQIQVLPSDASRTDQAANRQLPLPVQSASDQSQPPAQSLKTMVAMVAGALPHILLYCSLASLVACLIWLASRLPGYIDGRRKRRNPRLYAQAQILQQARRAERQGELLKMRNLLQQYHAHNLPDGPAQLLSELNDELDQLLFSTTPARAKDADKARILQKLNALGKALTRQTPRSTQRLTLPPLYPLATGSRMHE